MPKFAMLSNSMTVFHRTRQLKTLNISHNHIKKIECLDHLEHL